MAQEKTELKRRIESGKPVVLAEMRRRLARLIPPLCGRLPSG